MYPHRKDLPALKRNVLALVRKQKANPEKALRDIARSAEGSYRIGCLLFAILQERNISYVAAQEEDALLLAAVTGLSFVNGRPLNGILFAPEEVRGVFGQGARAALLSFAGTSPAFEERVASVGLVPDFFAALFSSSGKPETALEAEVVFTASDFKKAPGPKHAGL